MHISSRVLLTAGFCRPRIVFTALLSFCCLSFSQMTRGAEPFKDFNTYAKVALKDWNVPAMAVAVVKDGKIEFVQGYGIRTLGGNDAVDADTVFPIASITKAFTATAMAMLVDEGKVDWMDCVTKHLPEFQLRDPWLTREVRIADLLSHRTGLEDPDHSSGEFDRAELIRRTGFCHRLRHFDPGITTTTRA